MSNDPRPVLTPAQVEAIAARVVEAVSELPDRTSPDDQPEMMLVSGNELTRIVRDAVTAERDAPWWQAERSALVAQARAETPTRPKIICLCGSTRFIDHFAIKTWELELEGHIVLGCTLLPSWYCPVRDHFAEEQGVKAQRDAHHLQKIDLADEVLVLNLGGYIGESTRREIAYATETGKPVRYVEPLPAPPSVPPAEGH